MKITFIQPFYKNTWESISIGYIASYCKQKYNGNLDFNFFHGNFDKDDEIISGSINSDIVAFSCTSPTFERGVKLATSIKKENSNVNTVFGGHHVSALGLTGNINQKCIDQIVVGEGEDAFLDILNGNNDRIVIGSKIDFKKSPWTDRDLIRNDRTIRLCNDMIGVKIASFQANRGCPHRCSFCSEKNITGLITRENPMRSRHIDDVLDEIASVSSKYKLDKFKFVDATFDWNSRYVIEFCKRKIERNIVIPWECMIHVSSATEDMFPWLRDSNCDQINVGCESGSQRILKAMHKGSTVESIENVFMWGKKYEIERRAFFLLGMPEETEDDIRLTDELVEKINPDYFGITILCPYPGSDLYDKNKYRDIDWSNTDEYSNDFWFTSNFTNTELKEWQKKLTDKYKNKLCKRQKDMDSKL